MKNQNSSLESEQSVPSTNPSAFPLSVNNQMDHPSMLSQSSQPGQSMHVQSIPIQPMPIGQSVQSDQPIPIQQDQPIPIQPISIQPIPNHSIPNQQDQPIQLDQPIPIQPILVQPNQSSQSIGIEVDDNSTNSVGMDIPDIPSFDSLNETVNSTFSQFTESINDEDIDVEAEFNISPPIPVVKPNNEDDKQKLQELLTQAVSIIDSIPV